MTGVLFVLVIKGHKERWLPRLQKALQTALHTTIKTWGLGSGAVLVMNDEGARRRRLIA